MTLPTDCTQNRDSLKLVREGTSQDQRNSQALDPAYAPVNERKPEHGMVFAKAYSAFLQYYDSNNVSLDDWTRFFSEDESVQLAIAAIQDVDYYRQQVQVHFKVLNDHNNDVADAAVETKLREHLGALFSIAATLAWRLDDVKQNLPPEIRLKGALENLIQSQLAPAFKRLLLYYRDGLPPAPDAPYLIDVESPLSIMGATSTFNTVRSQGLSKEWIAEKNLANWADYLVQLDDLVNYPPTTIYGSGTTLFSRVNHIAGHNLFTSIFDQFLKVFARVVSDAKLALDDTFTKWDGHEPHYALFLAFLRVFEEARTEINTLTGRHLDFYYREVLKLKEKPAEPGHAHLLIELAKHVGSHEIKADELFQAGKDALGLDAFFANDQNFVANKAKVTGLKTLYRHENTPNDTLSFQGDRLFASPLANSGDGLGAKLTTVDQSWHPFFNKTYQDGKLTGINMPQAEVGFAIASHYLWMAEGERTLTIDFTVSGTATTLTSNRNDAIVCLVTTEKGWFEKAATKFISESGFLRLKITLSGADPAFTAYSPKVHGYNFASTLPVLLVKLRHQDDQEYLYRLVQDGVIETIAITVDVKGLKSLAVSNDFGTVDTSKPFQPFGASPIAGNALTIGSKELFQKTLASAAINLKWQSPPAPFGTTVNIKTAYLKAGVWNDSISDPIPIKETAFPLGAGANQSVIDEPDLPETEFYSTTSRHGFVRLITTESFGQSKYEQALIDYIKKLMDNDEALITNVNEAPGLVSKLTENVTSLIENSPLVTNDQSQKPLPPTGPFITELTIDYTAKQAISLNDPNVLSFNKRQALFFHLLPFGDCEQHPLLNPAQKVFLVPQFSFQRDNAKQDSNAEFYIGVTGLKPPQNLALLFQVADGTADPLSIKPVPHIHWSYLSGNEWIRFTNHDVQDGTDGLLNSGVVSFSIPDQASSTNTLLPSGQHWLRAAIAGESDAVCRLLAVSAQAMTVTFQDQGNDPAYSAQPLPPGTISKLDQPDAAVKQVSQPFAGFGGRASEQPSAFYTRISERLRHKDRAIALWDYERLVLEAFPHIYKAKCLNHTLYEPNETGTGIYKELAAGHVTLVTIPNQSFRNLRDPLRPYTPLAVLEDIKAFLTKRLSCFAILHVKNPEFEEVHVEFNMRLVEGADETFHVIKLQEAITRFLSPWAFSGGTSPSFGGKIFKSVLINFVEEQPYVDYVTDFSLFHHVNGEITEQSTGIEGSKAVSILVSVPAIQHKITPIKSVEAEASSENCRCEP